MRSIVNKIEEARATCEVLQPSIFACTETWLHGDIPDDIISINNYTVSRCDRVNRRGGGVGIYILNSIAYRTISILTTPECLECVWIFLYELKILLLCIYMPAVSADNRNLINLYLTATIDKLLLELSEPRLIICGDFNTFEMSDISSKFDVRDIVKSPTRGLSYLDKVFVSDDFVHCAKSEIGPPISTADHDCVLVTIDFPMPDSNTTGYKIVYDLRERFVSKFVTAVRDYDWDTLINSDLTVDSMCDTFQNVLESFFCDFIPKHIVPCSTRDKPWMSPYIKSLIHERWNACRTRKFVKYNRLSKIVKKQN